MHRMDGCAVLCNLERRRGLADSCFWASEPGVARRLLTFLASPRKVSKRRRPEVRRPAKTRGTLRYSKQQAAAELGLVDMLAQMVVTALALKQSSRNAPVVSALLGDSHRGPLDSSRLSPKQITTSVKPRRHQLTVSPLTMRPGPHVRSRAAEQTRGMSARTV